MSRWYRDSCPGIATGLQGPGRVHRSGRPPRSHRFGSGNGGSPRASAPVHGGTFPAPGGREGDDAATAPGCGYTFAGDGHCLGCAREPATAGGTAGYRAVCGSRLPATSPPPSSLPWLSSPSTGAVPRRTGRDRAHRPAIDDAHRGPAGGARPAGAQGRRRGPPGRPGGRVARGRGSSWPRTGPDASAFLAARLQDLTSEDRVVLAKAIPLLERLASRRRLTSARPGAGRPVTGPPLDPPRASPRRWALRAARVSRTFVRRSCAATASTDRQALVGLAPGQAR